MADQGLISQQAGPRRRALVTQGTVWLFQAGLILSIASLLAAGGLFLYRRSLSQTLVSWEEQVRAQESELRPELLNQLLQLSATVSSVRELLQNHIYLSNLLRLLEDVTRPDVIFSNLNYSSESRVAELNGSAANYGAVAQQLSLLDGHREVESVSFGGLSLGERGRVNFKIAFIVKASLTKLRSP